jgi:PAS domain S-box-containing protein
VGSHGALTLDPEGNIVDCEVGVEAMFGYRASELAGRHVSFLLPELASIPLLKSGMVNPRLAFLCHCGKSFTGIRREGWSFLVELFIHRVEGATRRPVRLMIRAADAVRHERLRERAGQTDG